MLERSQISHDGNRKNTFPNFNMYELVMEATSRNDKYDWLQYLTVRSVLWPRVCWRCDDKENTVPLCVLATVVQENNRQITDWYKQYAPRSQQWSWNGYPTETKTVYIQHTLCCEASCPYFVPGRYFRRINQLSVSNQVVHWTQQLWFAQSGVAIRCCRQAGEVNVRLGQLFAVIELHCCNFWQQVLKSWRLLIRNVW